jgi:hypothetical protein
MMLLLCSSYLVTEHCVVDHQYDYRSDDRDDHAVEVETGNLAGAGCAKDKASDDRPDNSEDNIEEKALARFVDDLARDETSDEA